MSFLISLLPTLVVLGLLILIHEFGHFLACRLTKVKVEKFSIGFGPEIFHWQGKETRYVVSLLPLGGFVKPAGESVSELENQGPQPGDYLAAPLWARMMIVVAGVAMNYFLAFVLFAIVFMAGRPVPGTTLGGFVDGYPAIESGLQVGDRIVSVDGHEVSTWNELTTSLEASPGTELSLMVERDGALQAYTVSPKVETVKDVFGQTHILKRLGITPNPEASVFERYGVGTAILRAGETVVHLTVLTHKAIYYLIMGKMSVKTLAGPIGIVALTGSAAQLGLPYVLQLAATLSVSLAVINLLPIPALDGGHLLFLIIEAIRRKRVSLEVQERATQVGFLLLMALMVFVIYNDLVNLDVYNKVMNLFRGAS